MKKGYHFMSFYFFILGGGGHSPSRSWAFSYTGNDNNGEFMCGGKRRRSSDLRLKLVSRQKRGEKEISQVILQKGTAKMIKNINNSLLKKST